MSKKATEFQRKAMSRMYRGKEIFKPLNTGWIDENVACVREWVANIFFYRKGDTTIMIDAGYNYDRLAEKMHWLGIDPQSIRHILITHQDTDHVGAVEADSPGLFRNAKLYIGEIENRYLTGEARRKVIYHLYKLPQVTMVCYLSGAADRSGGRACGGHGLSGRDAPHNSPAVSSDAVGFCHPFCDAACWKNVLYKRDACVSSGYMEPSAGRSTGYCAGNAGAGGHMDVCDEPEQHEQCHPDLVHRGCSL